MRAGSRLARRGLQRRLLWASLFIVACTLLWFTHIMRVAKDVVRVETPKGPRFSYQLSEQEQVQNSLWGLLHIWRPLEENSGAVPLRKLGVRARPDS